MTPTGIISAIAILAKEAYELAQKVEINKAQSIRLASRIQSVSTVLSRLEQVKDSAEFKTSLEALHQHTTQAKMFIEGFSVKTTWVKRALKAGTDEREFQRYNEALSDSITTLKLSIDVQQLFNREQDTQDIVLDTALLEKFHNEVIDGQAKIQQQLAEVKAGQDAQAKQMLAHLQSLKGHIQGSPHHAAPQTLVAPAYQANIGSLATGVVLLNIEEAKAVYTQGQQAEKTGNFTQAAKQYQQAANAGYYRAQTNLGTCYLKGQGVPLNKPKAYELFKQAADAGHVRAMCNLYTMLSHGDGITKDIDAAKEWLKKAAQKDDNWAKQKCGELNISLAKLTL